mmetsp:Transcript_30775/g.73856  ORF Transcript_30775/g.73856 Transcript_30775/m.73856 type:complete len:755 (+) Transcript_30775:2481-4745(+)|eukprot:CAMPEP_0113655084 /NCGR_PEP_ID=MMETSP0017_2-20120614/29504_1 /TAXON_ID=2856 /ORGANISM="Cylindrotheca closterium" /LENGTH=754 /DNA_ID=CAMNT_0000568281 /DNA_START=1656 /DNA_END=3920 /DNA_ORIENTATION=- /assembly_acc=CAM_ASM_000147
MNPSINNTQTLDSNNNDDGWITVASTSNKRNLVTPSPKRKNVRRTNTIVMQAPSPRNQISSLLNNETLSFSSNKSSQGLLLDLPSDVLSRGVLSFLGPQELLSLGACSKQTKSLCDQGYLWQTRFQKDFCWNSRSAVSEEGWKFAYQIFQGGLQNSMRCFHNRNSCVEDVVGVGLDFTVNPKKRTVDYISLSQDLLSQTAFDRDHIRQDVFENKFKLFLPLYFTREHFQRALPRIQRTVVKLCPEKKTTKFFPSMILDVFPKIVNTFVVLLSDQGVSACQKSFDGLIRIHRLFLALAQEYPVIQKQAAQRLQAFVSNEKNRLKFKCPSLGSILPLLMIVDEDVFNWSNIRGKYLTEMFDRCVLWVCKEYPHLAKAPKQETAEQEDDRITCTREAVYVSLRLTMFHVFFNKVCCKGTVLDRALSCDAFFLEPKKTAKQTVYKQVEVSSNTLFDYILEQAVQNSTPTSSTSEESSSQLSSEEESMKEQEEEEPVMVKSVLKHSIVSFTDFRNQVNTILTMNSWQRFFRFVGLKGPQSKSEMASLLRMHVHNSLRKKYHKKGMDFSRVHASGTSSILAKGQKYSVASDLKRVVFTDVWKFNGATKFLDATCLVYAGKRRLETIDYMNRLGCGGAIVHSGDQLEEQQGTHTITIDLKKLPDSVTTCMFVISAWADATLSDIVSPSIAFRDADAAQDAAPLCKYDLDKHDKVSHLTSVIMCKLYRLPGGKKWHVLAIGDSHQGAADKYGPIYKAAAELL